MERLCSINCIAVAQTGAIGIKRALGKLGGISSGLQSKVKAWKQLWEEETTAGE